ncbi:MAG: SpoIIE family protein phosphatase [Bacteroidales bacterium]|nr:SpoIIE family protein phosphatase [Bacteroidales bacterium]MCF8454284.1 SpoIIE family protein phosphatase [Bacteroidales bacterium]
MENTISILCVDDEQDMEMLITQKFRRNIRNKEYSFIFAQNGVQALEQLEKNPEVSLILSDINMPEMDGLTFLSKLKERKNAELKTIMVSAYGDMDNIRTAMNRGAFDFITKPINMEDMELTITKTLEEINQYKTFQKDRDKLVSIQKDLIIAYDIQQSMLPKTFPAFPDRTDFDLHGLVQPAKSVGGDLYDYFLIDEDHLFFMVGDVSDKGISAALFMAITKSLINTNISSEKNPNMVEEIMKINKALSANNTSMMFVTIFVCVLNLKTGEVNYVDGGHERPLILREGKKVEVFEKITGLPICVDADFPYKQYQFNIQPGDSIILYSDGLEDAKNPAGECRTIQPSIEILESLEPNQKPEQINALLLKEVNNYIDTADQFDDITILTVNYYG